MFMMRDVAALLVLLPLTAGFTLANNGLQIEISTDPSSFGSLLSFQHNSRDALAQPSPSLWTATLVDSNNHSCNLDGTSQAVNTSFTVDVNASSASLHWQTSGCAVGGTGVDLTLNLNISQAAQLTLELTVSPLVGGAALWRYGVGVAGVKLDDTMSILENSGFGVVHKCPACHTFTSNYPQSTFQFVGAYGNGAGAPGMYFGCHDSDAASKNFAVTVGTGVVSFGMSATAPDAGRTGWTAFKAAPVVLAAHHTDWWDMSQIYRSWALPSASWTAAGPLSSRTDVPNWLLNVTTWINSHWQQVDVFNTTGGDPAVVLQQVKAIAQRFSPGIGGERAPLALHWYEWDTLGYKEGSNYTQCASEITCGFDTHYPEYFPVRQGFQAALQEMQAIGVRVAPYINGRIFDEATESWTHDSARKFAAKRTDTPVSIPSAGVNGSSLGIYEEQYGSQAKFSVMCPHTEYWQHTIADVTDKLVNTYGTDGVYIDQIAAAGPAACFDPSHNHSLGGGNHWVTGYRQMLKQVRKAVGPDSVVLTESNAEPFMDGVNVFLTLVGFSAPATGDSHMVSAFQAVYGGYFLAAGAEFFSTDFSPNPNVFAAKVAQQFLFGAQLGWFSLGGRNNEAPPMGIYNQLMDPAYDSEIAYLQLLSMARQRCSQWLVHGHAMRPVALNVNQTGTSLQNAAVPSIAWLSPDSRSLLVAITAVERHSPATSLSFSVSMLDYGFPETGGPNFQLSQLGVDGSTTLLGNFTSDIVSYQGVLAARQVTLLTLSAA